MINLISLIRFWVQSDAFCSVENNFHENENERGFAERKVLFATGHSIFICNSIILADLFAKEMAIYLTIKPQKCVSECISPRILSNDERPIKLLAFCYRSELFDSAKRAVSINCCIYCYRANNRTFSTWFRMSIIKKIDRKDWCEIQDFRFVLHSRAEPRVATLKSANTVNDCLEFQRISIDEFITKWNNKKI